MVLALLSMAVVQAFRIPSHRWLPGLCLETLFFLAAPILFFVFFVRRLSINELNFKSGPTVYRVQAGALAMALTVVFVQWLSRMSGLGDPNEIVALLMVQCVSWYLAVFSRFASFSKVAFLLSGSIVLFVCFMAETVAVFALTFLYSVIALWWLLGNYWNRLNQKALDVSSQTRSINGFAIGVTVVFLSVVGMVAWMAVPENGGNSRRGFSFFSGGEDGDESDFARSGFGDGNMLTAGDNATTSGAVDSDQFIEDDKPSIYDITSEKYDGPLKIKKIENRAVALDAIAKHLHEVIQSEQAGKTFRTVRKPKNSDDLDLENRISDALFYVEGSVPARFAIDTFHHFDGWDWAKTPELKSDQKRLPAIRIEKHLGKPWFVIQKLEREFLSVTRPHRIKMMRFKNNVVPATPFLRAWHVHRVDDPRMFYWNESGLIRMDGSLIPAQTVINIVSHVPNYHVLRSSKSLKFVNPPSPIWERVDTSSRVGPAPDSGVDKTDTAQSADAPFLQIPDNETKTRIAELAEKWTHGHSTGWNQVEAIVERMRSDYQLSPTLTAPPDGTDSVKSFLDQGGGPSYLFATAATQILRAAGYRTRLAKGFLIDKDDYDRVANQSAVTADNMHVWPEVSLDGWHWIPVEPTPGYPIPYSHQTILQWAQAQILAAIRWVVLRPVTSVLFTLITLALVRFRREVFAFVYWLIWLSAGTLMPARRLSLTRRLIDIRFWAAGFSRPRFATITEWFSQIDPEIGQDFFRFWQINNYRTRPLEKNLRGEITSACKSAVAELSYQRIKVFVRQTNSKVVK